MKKKKIAVIIGTRPEAIKLAPVIKALRAQPDHFETVVISTAQHRQMLDQILTLFRIVPDRDLDLMRPNQKLDELTARALLALGGALAEEKPDMLVVQGDTTTVFAASVAAFYAGVPVGHVEAGLRSHDLANPYPEEANRRLTSVLTALHFAPTEQARVDLLAENHPPGRVVVTGNTVIDALLDIAGLDDPPGELIPGLDPAKRLILVTSHRRESHGRELDNICQALRDIAAAYPDVAIVYPVHLNPNVRNVVFPRLDGCPGVHLVEPLDYFRFVKLMKRAYLILTDSGGVQEEAPTFGVPVLVLRLVTERPEASRRGQSRIIGTDRERVVAETRRLLDDPAAYAAMSEGGNPYGDGRAAWRVTQAVRRYFEGGEPLLTDQEAFDPDR